MTTLVSRTTTAPPVPLTSGSPPLIAQTREVVRAVVAGALPSVLDDHVRRPNQDDPPGAGRPHDQLVARLQAGAAERLDRNRRLMLAADSRPPPTPCSLYFGHPE